MESMLQHSPCQNFGTNCEDRIAMVKESHAWPKFTTKLKAIKMLQLCFPDFKIFHIPKAQNKIFDLLAKNARSFTLYISCFILIWIPRPSQV